jgi:hypothetical protein
MPQDPKSTGAAISRFARTAARTDVRSVGSDLAPPEVLNRSFDLG